MTASRFLGNQWYVAAFSDEILDKPVARTVCNEPVAVYRGNDGIVRTLSDRCPHRMAPLSSGCVEGNDLACGYHGIRFNGQGACTHMPGNTAIDPRFKARSFPTIERHNLIFIWIGEVEKADESKIPNYYQANSPDWAFAKGYLHIKGNYQLLIDNILDLTHVVFVHKTTLSGGGITEAPLEVETDGNMMRAQRRMYNVDTAPIYKAARNLHGKIDRWQMFEFWPPIYCALTLGAREAGSDEPFGKPTHVVLNVFSPETDTTTHYFWFATRDWALHDDKVQSIYQAMHDQAFREDAAIVERQQELISSDPGGGALVNLPFDKAAVAARRIIRRMFDGEKRQPEKAEA